MRATPETATLFDVRDALKTSEHDRKFIEIYVAKMPCVAKRVKPECFTAVAFLSTRVNICDRDDVAMLRRLLG